MRKLELNVNKINAFLGSRHCLSSGDYNEKIRKRSIIIDRWHRLLPSLLIEDTLKDNNYGQRIQECSKRMA